jgi:hypothetical protein
MQRAREHELSTADLVASAGRFDVPVFLESLRAALVGARRPAVHDQSGAGARP